MRIGCNTGGPGETVLYRGSHGQTVRVGRSGRGGDRIGDVGIGEVGIGGVVTGEVVVQLRGAGGV